ncbi:MAG: hypothetical protein LBN94_00395 [Puniceicoccales bacterium]|jgi:YrbI family 3-deoxy-D-manno-octulosonate 8-phosphate phosphatase|nr:hypothetical protein [Puniceicoccales bacterium]
MNPIFPPLDFERIKWVIMGESTFDNPREILTLPQDGFSSGDAPVYSDGKNSTAPISAMPFRTYDGFAIKNILGHVLKIPSVLATHLPDFHGVMERRCRDLKMPFCFTGIQNKVTFLGEFCREQRCNFSDLIVFDDDLIDGDFPPEKPPHLISKRNYKGIQHHLVRHFINHYADSNGKVLTYYDETGEHKFQCPESIRSKAKKIQAIICDIDGTCTDGFKIYGEDGSNWKRFSATDVDALRRWNEEGKYIFFITGEPDIIPKKLGQCIQIPAENIFGNAGNQKINILNQIALQWQLQFGEIAYIGDDVNDLGISKYLIAENGIVGCPANAMPMIKTIPSILQLKTYGGHGAIADFIENVQGINRWR